MINKLKNNKNNIYIYIYIWPPYCHSIHDLVGHMTDSAAATGWIRSINTQIEVKSVTRTQSVSRINSLLCFLNRSKVYS